MCVCVCVRVRVCARVCVCVCVCVHVCALCMRGYGGCMYACVLVNLAYFTATLVRCGP